MKDKMKVTVIERHGLDLCLTTVSISNRCPVCGGERGKPYWYHFCEDGDWYDVQRWDNPCGHVDKYSDVLKEADMAVVR